MTFKVISANNIDLDTLIIEGNKLKVNVARVVPAAKADVFLKEVGVSEDKTKLVFKTGTDTETNAPLEIPVANFLEGVVKTQDLQAAVAPLATTEALNTLTQALDAEKAKVQEAQGKIETLEQKVAELEAAKATPAKLAELVADPAVKAAIIAAIKGEEVTDLEDAVKGYLIATA